MHDGTMPAAVLHGPGDLRVEQRPVPVPGPHDVVVEVSHCGVCGTDLHMVVEGWGRPGSVGGHEWSGTVVAVGSDVSTPAVGDAVVGGPPPGCGTCTPCHARQPSLCLDRAQPGDEDGDGAFARYVRAHRDAVVPVPAGLDLRIAALAEPLAVALHAVTRSGVRPGQRALVTGAGPIGALAVVALRARGVGEVLVSEPSPARQALAERLGATVVDPASFDVPNIAEPARIVTDAVDVALECSGKRPAMEAAFTQLRRGGTLVLVGTGIEAPRLDPNRMILNELVVTGAFEYDADGIAEALDLLASGTADVGALIEPEDVGLDELGAAMVDLAAGRIAGKVLVAPGGA
ncbi:MAG TPA: alcohol dehydrogenase catalytic domain-containing protein [Acidimicrobiales bacterium]|nr:alcohol dehydrogenase catalytic domain-containing protein [Acidimicrobiales bacterium]